MQPLALITSRASPQLSESDRWLVTPLRAQGFEPIALPWDSKDVAWETFAAVVIRSAWDYHTRLQEYLVWLNSLEQLHVQVWNPLAIVRWNLEKSYLLDLENQGIALLPTAWLQQGSECYLLDLLEEKQWQEAVVKPTVGASASQVLKVHQREAEQMQSHLFQMLQTSAVMVQPFMQKVQTEGEYSFIFIGEQYSHAMLKRPQTHEFRVQPKYGGTAIPINPSHTLIQQARHIHEVLLHPLLYARIDAIQVEGKLVVMEVEVHEPGLFFPGHPQAAELFARTLRDYHSR